MSGHDDRPRPVHGREDDGPAGAVDPEAAALLEQLLDEAHGRSPAAPGSSVASGERARVRRLFATARAADLREEWSPARERRFVRRVLDATTRLDPGWRGDLRLIARFVRQRMAQSRMVRIAAASLLVHVGIVLPALAYLALHPEARPQFWTGIEPRPTSHFEDPGPEPALELPAIPPLSPEALRAEREDNARRLVRHAWSAAGAAPALDLPARAPAEADVAAALLAVRAAMTRGDEAPAWVDALGAGAELEAPTRALLALVQLDRAVLAGTRPLSLGPLLNALALAESRGSAGPLARLVLVRARVCGEWNDAGPVPTPADPRAGLPFGADEAAALAASLPPRTPGLAAWGDWLARRGR